MPQPKQALSVKDLAEKLGTEPRTLRAFLRRTGHGAGKGSRYVFDAAAIKKVTAAWEAEQAAAAVGPEDAE